MQGYDTWQGAAALLSTVGALFFIGSFLGPQRKYYSVGVVAAAAILSVILTWSAIAPAGSKPSPALLLLVVFPVLEEASKAFCVYSVLPSLDPDWRGWGAFAAGYAGVESTYKATLVLIGASVHHTLDENVLGGALFAFVVPLTALLSLTLLMCVLRRKGIGASGAFFICVVLHFSYNLLGVLPVPSVAWAALWIEGLIRVIAAGGASCLLIQILRRTENGTALS